MMNIFNKKPKNEAQYDDSYDNDFYRGPEDDENVVGEEDDNDLIPPVPTAQKKPTAPATNAWKVVKPHDAQDGLVIADYLMHGYTVVMNIESLERDMIVRLIDFLQGAVHVLDGEINRVSKTTFVLSPRKGEMTEDTEIARRTEGNDYL